jgi:hypothetical protein
VGVHAGKKGMQTVINANIKTRGLQM